MVRVLFLFGLLSISLFAEDYAGEIFTYGYHNFIVENLKAVSSIIGMEDDYLMKIVVGLSLFLLFVRTAINPNGGASMLTFHLTKAMLAIVVVQSLFLKTSDDAAHRYLVTDRITNEATYVDEVPKGLGEMLSFFTNLEDAIMAGMDSVFTTPESTSFRNAGIGFNIITAQEIFKSKMYDPKVQRSFFYYFENCKMLGDFSDGTQDITDLTYTEDPMTLMETDQTLSTIVWNEVIQTEWKKNVTMHGMKI